MFKHSALSVCVVLGFVAPLAAQAPLHERIDQAIAAKPNFHSNLSAR